MTAPTYAQAAGQPLDLADKILFVMAVDVYHLVRHHLTANQPARALEFLAMIAPEMNRYMDKLEGRCENLVRYFTDACDLVADFSKIERESK